MERYGYDVAQICSNGHLINHSARSYPQHNKRFCDKCGAETIMACQNCNDEIKGIYRPMGALRVAKRYIIPSFCPNCGSAYPWTTTKIEALKKLAQEAEDFSADEKRDLVTYVDDIVRDTPNTVVAITRFKKILSKAKGPILEAFKRILVEVACEAAKKSLWR